MGQYGTVSAWFAVVKTVSGEGTLVSLSELGIANSYTTGAGSARRNVRRGLVHFEDHPQPQPGRGALVHH